MARKAGTVKPFLALWQCHENLYYSIFYKALKRLNINDVQRKDEDAISEALCPVLTEVCFEHIEDVSTPKWEGSIQPVTKDELKGGKSRKRPDFTCSLTNSIATSSEMYEIPFHVECKRLGDTVGSWNLNKNYVTNGIKRFDCKSHEYGKRAPSGMMIGYIVSMEPIVILEIVNKYLSTDKFPLLNLSFSQKTVSCEQELMRKYVKPEEFKLIHLWVNLKT